MQRKWFWVLSPAVLIAAMQVVTIPLLSRKLDVDALLSFQAMLSSWPWLGMMSLGLDKKARELVSSTPAFVAFQGIWTNVMIVGLVIGCALGVVGSLLFGNWMSWLFFCGFSAISGAMSPAREIFFARGKAVWIGKIHAVSLVVSLLALVACLALPLSLVSIALIWVVPQFCAWAYVCREADFHLVRPARLAAMRTALRDSLPFALQGAGFIALSSFDVLILRSQLSNAQLLYYLLSTRTVALAFLFSGAVGNTLIRLTIGIGQRAWFRLLLIAFAVHLGASLIAVLGVCLLGDRVFTMLVPGIVFRFTDVHVLLALGGLAVGRSLSEAALQMTGRLKTHWIALNVFLLSLAGVVQLTIWPSSDFIQALRQVALGWGLPAVYLLLLSLAKRRT